MAWTDPKTQGERPSGTVAPIIAHLSTAGCLPMPMVVMSHGTGGCYLGHFDTAMALADAGFVVVAVNHTGDNHADQSRSVDVMDRPRQISHVMDHMLSTGEGRAVTDSQRVGMLAFPQADSPRSRSSVASRASRRSA